MNNKETSTFEQDYVEFTGCRMEDAELTMTTEAKVEREQAHDRIKEIKAKLSESSDEAKALVNKLSDMFTMVGTIDCMACYETGLKDGARLAGKLGL